MSEVSVFRRAVIMGAGWNIPDLSQNTLVIDLMAGIITRHKYRSDLWTKGRVGGRSRRPAFMGYLTDWKDAKVTRTVPAPRLVNRLTVALRCRCMRQLGADNAVGSHTQHRTMATFLQSETKSRADATHTHITQDHKRLRNRRAEPKLDSNRRFARLVLRLRLGTQTGRRRSSKIAV